MTDDQKGVTTNVGEDANVSATPAEEPKAAGEAGTPVTEPTGEVTEETQAETGESLKKGANARIRELNAKAKAAEERARSLEQRIAELTQPTEYRPYNIPFNPQEPIVNPGEEIDGLELNRRLAEREQRILAQAEARAELRSRQIESINRINRETQEIMRAYPELDPDSGSFDKQLSDAVTEATIAHIKANPYNASPKEIVEKMMRPYKRAVTNEVGKVSENLARQVSQAAQRPTGVTTSGKKSYKDMSIKELEAELGITY